QYNVTVQQKLNKGLTIKYVHEREHVREISELVEKHKDELKSQRLHFLSEQQELKDRLNEAHLIELDQMKLQFQNESALEREALRLSLTNLYTAQLELSQSNLLQEKESALSELRENLNDKRSQEVAMLQTRHHFEMEKVKGHYSEIISLQRMYDDLKTHSDQEIKHLWSQLENTRTSRQELGELKEQLLARASHVEDIERLKQELTQQRLDLKSQHERELENLRTYLSKSYMRQETSTLHCFAEAVTKNSADEDIFNTERSDLLREMTEKLEQNKMELDLLRLKLEEKHLNELEAQRSTLTLKFKEDLLNMKTDLSDRYFAEIQELKTKHSLELEQLRARLSDSHIKEITKIRLQSAHDAAQQVEAEVAERLLLVKSEKQRIAQLEEQIESLKQENSEILKHLTETQQMFEKENTEKVDEARKEESDKAAKILSEKDAELKQLQDELQSASEERITAIQVDLSKIAEQEREALVKEFEARELELKALQNKQEAIISELEKELKEERNQLQKLQDSLDGKQSSKIMQHENIQTEFDDELDISNSKIAEEMTLLKSRVEESQFKLEEKKLMADQLDKSLRELEAAQAEELEMMRRFLQEQHHKELVALEKELTAKHQIKMETVINDLQSAHRTRLQEVEQDLCKKHTMEMKEMENRFLSNIDTLESTYLSQIQSLRKEHDQTVNVLKSSHRDELQRLKIEDETTLADSLEKIKVEHEAQMISAMEQLKKELSMIHMEKFKAMAAEVEKVHKEELISHMKRQAAEMEAEHSKALGVLQTEVLRLEENHQATMLKLQKFHLEEVCRREEEYSQQLHSEMEKMKILHLEQLKECSNVSACEMDSLKEKLLAQFNEEKNIQQIRFQEEIELLKCQSEILLEQQISQLKVCIHYDFILENAIFFHAFISESKTKNETFNFSYFPPTYLQLSNKMSLLQKEIDIKNSNQDTLLQRRERENEEAENKHIKITSNQVLVFNMYLLNSFSISDEVQSQCSEGESESSHWSSITDKTLRSSQLLYESSIASPEQERENHILLICDRLRGTVEKLLELVVESALQVRIISIFRKYSPFRTSECFIMIIIIFENLSVVCYYSGCVAEKAALEEVLQQTIKKEHQLAVEVDTLRERLHDLSEEHNLLVRLLEEANRLAKEKLDLQCQAEKDRCSLTNRLKILENELEDQMNSNTELEDKRKTEVTDLKQQILALEKQLRNNRQFMDDQAVEREHERDEFQQEIKKLETQLKQQFRSNTGMEYQGQQVETLQETIKKKTDEYNILLLAKEQTDNYLTEQLEETEKLASHIRELEENVLSNAEATRKVIQLEQEIQRLKKSEMELMEYKEALQQQQYANRMQISALQTKLDETRHRIPEDHSDQVLKQQIEAKHESLVNKEKENAILINQIEHLERDLLSKSEELIQINIQLGLQAKTNTSKVNSLQNEIIQLKDIITNLQEHRRIDPDSTSSVMQLPQALLEEKNQEIDHLNDQLLRLQQEHELNNKMLEEKNSEAEDMKSQIERYVGDLDRLRQDKADEVERLHEVIYKLQEEIDQLGPNCHEISDSQEDLPLDRLDNRGSLQHELWQEERLQQELATEHIQLSDARVKELEQQMENACIERETLQQLLQKQEAHFRSEMEKLGKSLQNEKLQHHSLQEEYNLLKAHLTEQEAEAAHLSTKTQELEDLLRERECQLVEAEVQAKGTEEKRQAEILSLKHLPAKVADLEAELQKRLDVSMEADHLKTEKSLLNAQLLELNEIILRKTGEIEMLQNEVVKLQTHIEEIGSEKGQLFAESTDLKQKMLSLNDEVDRLKTEVTTKNAQIQDFLIQLEDNQTKHSGTERMLNLLQKVYHEARLVLSLSEEYGSYTKPSINTKLSDIESWQVEKQALQEILQSLKEMISKMLDHSDKEEKQNAALGNLLAADRRSMLVEIQTLQAELRISHLQNQERLQQLQSSLSHTEEQGNKREHQLRRQAELLKYKLQQEQAIVNDLQDSLKSEQDRSAELRSHFRSEQDAVADLKRELLAVNQTLETSLKKEHDLQKELENLRCSCLSECLETDLHFAEKNLEEEQKKVKEFHELLDQERLRNIQREDHDGHTQEVLRTSLEDRNIQNNQLCAALEQERVISSNLRKELQIEQSRCEALISQERNKLAEAQQLLQIEKTRSYELSDAVKREQQRLAQEYCQKLKEEAVQRVEQMSQDQNLIHELQMQVNQEKDRSLELACMIEKTQQQAIQAKRQMESEAQQNMLELKKAQELVAKLQKSVETLQVQKLNLTQGFEREREQFTERLRSEVDKLQRKFLSVKEKEKKEAMFLQQLKLAQQQVQMAVVRLKDFSQANTSSVLASERAAWQKEKAFLTSALNKAESELARMTAENENRPIGDSSSKIQRLYAKYLRTESFRKALVYQKKYLLLLLGGFQDTEREILSLIARMGVYPSPKDLQNTASTSRPISKFRSAVRVLIAISRLRFLVKKWQKATKKSHPPVASVSGNGHSLVHGTRTEVLRPQHSTIIFNSPPTRENVSFNRSTHIVQSPKSPYKSHEQSITSSQDAERSLTEYIHHLEAVQQRLGGHKLGEQEDSIKSICV
uniref:Pericentrin n=1 Tax=Erpetoichthys calabaricus TaxID=27687 RepID=A0A8C4STW9_ERPCA